MADKKPTAAGVVALCLFAVVGWLFLAHGCRNSSGTKPAAKEEPARPLPGFTITDQQFVRKQKRDVRVELSRESTIAELETIVGRVVRGDAETYAETNVYFSLESKPDKLYAVGQQKGWQREVTMAP